ncbi:Phthalate dioxygenase reductase [Corynebacterium occultum]|uniref:Phthalate dioxygenase reductase n=1 Tax=Corynebacterium occultum TaxID=2675219 RepID=A0A6B8VSQ7_9CORY|nr:PDR/VanB family oxidoreductase [Corynebacterium occultum]QGU08632.1 Phthalate dioxygenase reductase [Corynebacterium occultum]
MSLIDVVVSDIVQETPTIKSFYLSLPDGTPIGHYSPGAHIDVVGPTSLTRQYSLCGRPDGDNAYLFAVKREEVGRGGSEALHDLQVGDQLKISAPRNLLQMDESASHHVLIAGGIGITPMLSLARYMDVRDIPFDLHYYARSEEEAAFLPLLTEKCPDKLHAHLGVDRDTQRKNLDKMVQSVPEGTHLYVCGPAPFMDQVREIAGKKLPEEAIHFENFKPAEADADQINTEFDVELDGETYHIPAERSIVDVLNEAGCGIDTSCEEGICGTCIMEVLEGTPEHRDSVLTKAEREAGETMAVCVSRTKGTKLVLEYF